MVTILVWVKGYVFVFVFYENLLTLTSHQTGVVTLTQ